MARLSKKHKNLIVDVVTRWAHTLAGTRPFNLDRVRELLRAAYKNETITKRKRIKNKKTGASRTTFKKIKLNEPALFIVQSPAAFRIAAAVMRGLMSKKQARDAAKNMDIDPSFIEPLRRDSMRSFKYTPRYTWGGSHQPLLRVWDDTLTDYVHGATSAAFAREPVSRLRRGREVTESDTTRIRKMFEKSFTALPEYDYSAANIQLTNNQVSRISHFGINRNSGQSSVERAVLGEFYAADLTSSEMLKLGHVADSSAALSALFDRIDLLWLDNRHTHGFIDAEIMLKMLGVSDLQQTWRYELMHEAACVMTFTHSALVLDSRPVIKHNSAGELHCEDGPAVQWPDGAKMYYIDGHSLRTNGKMICDTPDQITLNAIKTEENEEIKRVLIDKYGWPRYLADIKAVVIDRRENWVDNTIEALVELTEHRDREVWVSWNQPRRKETIAIKKRKLVLACRSTGRQYFLSVPEDTRTCEAGQKWISSGAATDVVPALNYPARLVGAS